jgi:hypothetical protein
MMVKMVVMMVVVMMRVLRIGGLAAMQHDAGRKYHHAITPSRHHAITPSRVYVKEQERQIEALYSGVRSDSQLMVSYFAVVCTLHILYSSSHRIDVCHRFMTEWERE